MISTIFGDVAIETASSRKMRQAEEGGIKLITLIHNGQTTAALNEIAHGANVNARSLGGNWTALGAAAAMGDVKIIPALLKAGAKPNAKDIQGRTAIDIAKTYGHKAVETQLKKAAKPALKNSHKKKARRPSSST